MTCFQKTTSSKTGTAFQADKVTHCDAQSLDIFAIVHLFIEDHFHGAVVTLRISGFAIGMNGRIEEMNRAFVTLAFTGVHEHVFLFHVVQWVTAQKAEAQATIRLDHTDHQSERINMRREEQRLVIRPRFAALSGSGKLAENPAFLPLPGLKAQILQTFHEIS